MKAVFLRNISFTYEAMSDWLFQDLTLSFPTGWTGVVGANGTGKTTLVKLATGELKPLRGSIELASEAIYCQQRTDDVPKGLDELLQATDGESSAIKGRLGIQEDWPDRWDTLSHGERKRAQIAVALWRHPQVLAVDEPTNHLDIEAREMLLKALREYDGIGLLISHDRELLDGLCSQCVFLDPPTAVMRPGGYSRAVAQAAQERESARKRRELAKRELEKLQRTAVLRREIASRADKMRSKRDLSPRDHDAREKIDRARFTGKDGDAGRLLRQLDGRLEQAEDKLESSRVKKEYRLGIWLPGERSRHDFLFTIPTGELPLGEHRCLKFPTLAMRPDDRVAITGPNGAGKSTLVNHIVGSLNILSERLVYIPQEIDLGSSKEILDSVRGLNDEELGRMMTVVSRLGSRPSRLLESIEPSPGEVCKLVLALGIVKLPHLIVMDEPTNHMDLPSIECLEEALADCPCALLLVSHDLRFLSNLAKVRWHISRSEGNHDDFILRRSEFD